MSKEESSTVYEKIISYVDVNGNEESAKYIPLDNVYVFTPEQLKEHDLIVIQLHEGRKKTQFKTP